MLAFVIMISAGIGAFLGVSLAARTVTHRIDEARKAIRHDQIVLARFLRDEIRKLKPGLFIA